MNLKLYFLGNSDLYSLDQVVFTPKSHSASLISRRGDGYSEDHSFKWSQGVRSLSLFFAEALRSVLSNDVINQALLSGYQGSTAASLDYALSKQPVWMSEMFGSDHLGKTILSKLIR